MDNAMDKEIWVAASILPRLTMISEGKWHSERERKQSRTYAQTARERTKLFVATTRPGGEAGERHFGQRRPKKPDESRRHRCEPANCSRPDTHMQGAAAGTELGRNARRRHLRLRQCGSTPVRPTRRAHILGESWPRAQCREAEIALEAELDGETLQENVVQRRTALDRSGWTPKPFSSGGLGMRITMLADSFTGGALLSAFDEETRLLIRET